MRTKLRYLLTALAAIFVALHAGAAIEIDGIYYNLMPDYWEASVVPRPDQQPYTQTSIVIPDSITYNGYKYYVSMVKSGSFSNTVNLESIKFLGGDMYYEYHAFKGSNVSRIEFPYGFLQLSSDCFADCENIDSIIFNGQKTRMYSTTPINAKKIIFKGDSELVTPFIHTMPGKRSASELSDPTDGETVYQKTEIDWGEGNHYINLLTWFKGEKFTIGGRVRLFGFVNDENLKVLEIEKRVQRTSNYDVAFYGYAFQYCPKLETIICHDPTPWPITDFKFDDPDQMDRITVYVPAEAVDTYKADPHWGKFSRILPITDGVTDITADGADMDAEAPVEYFNMQGQRVDSPQSGTVAIRRQGSKATKIVVK